MKDMIYIIGIFFCAALSFTVGKMEGTTAGLAAAAVIAPAVDVDVEKQCVAWFFNADLKAAKKHMCGKK